MLLRYTGLISKPRKMSAGVVPGPVCVVPGPVGVVPGPVCFEVRMMPDSVPCLHSQLEYK